MPLKTGVVAAALVLASASLSRADEAFDSCVRQLCTSLSQQDCFIKGGAAVCDEDQIYCEELPDMVPAIAVKKVGRRWLVQTVYGEGWVSDRMTMVNSGMCTN